jgi:hypothetical protein
MKRSNQGRKKNRSVAILGASILLSLALSPSIMSAAFPPPDDSDQIHRAFQHRNSNLLVETEATVVRIYPDIEDTRTYQQFRVRLPNGHELMVMHDLDQALRVPLDVNDAIRLRGEYDWTSRGGVIHWTHDDPERKREGGWIEMGGKKYL